jgi:hypothetical protein
MPLMQYVTKIKKYGYCRYFLYAVIACCISAKIQRMFTVSQNKYEPSICANATTNITDSVLHGKLRGVLLPKHMEYYHPFRGKIVIII